MSDPKVSYFGNNYRLNNGWKSAIKTGTTNNKDNGWLMGYTNKISFGLWMGRQNDNNPQYNFTDTILGPAWNSFMTQANATLGYTKGSGWDKPAGIKTLCLNPITGYATTSGGTCDIFPSWYQPRYPDSSKKAEIDSVSKKLATECTPTLARQTITGGGIMSELPTSDPMYRNWIAPVQARYGAAGGSIPTDKDDVHTCDPADKPTISLIVTDMPDGCAIFGQAQHAAGCSHAFEFAILPTAIVDCLVRCIDGLTHAALDRWGITLEIRMRQCVDRNATGKISHRMATHSVCHHKQVSAAMPFVIVGTQTHRE
jgi:hypothetical protein